jgi:hypothetical protein
MRNAVMSAMRNPVFVLAWALPAVAVVACVVTLIITLRNPDGQLPEQYHWEGFQLDRDFSRAAQAAQLGVAATVSGLNGTGRCELRLRMNGAAPDALVLMLSHATRSDIDQQISFRRVQAEPGWNDASDGYVAECKAVPAGHWRIELIDAVNGWAIRQNVRGSLDLVTLDAVAGHQG